MYEILKVANTPRLVGKYFPLTVLECESKGMFFKNDIREREAMV